MIVEQVAQNGFLTNSGVETGVPVSVAPVVCGAVVHCANAGTLNRAQVIARARVNFMAYSYIGLMTISANTQPLY